MKNLGVVILGVVMSFALVSCGASSTQVEDTQTVGTEVTVAGENGTPSLGQSAQELPENVKLMVGTFLLENTEDAVTSEQASELVVLWKAYRSLSNSDTTAAEEIKALINQIQDTMTPAQLNTISAMDVSQEDMFTVAQDLGIVPEDFVGSGQGTGDGEGFQGRGFGNLPEGGNPNGGPPEGGLPEGGFRGGQGAGGPGPGGLGGEIDPEAIATLQAERGGTQGFGARFNSFLLDPLIELLESKIQA
jgi:hypothetical protein